MKTCPFPPYRSAPAIELDRQHERDHIDQPHDVPESLEPTEDPDDPSDFEDFDATPDDDNRWEVLLPDDDDYDRDPDLSDFEGSIDPEAWSEEPE